jgi:hypothetical protein
LRNHETKAEHQALDATLSFSVTEVSIVENPILEKVRSGASGQTFALPTKKKVSEQMEVASAPTYASILKKGLKWTPVTVHSF